MSKQTNIYEETEHFALKIHSIRELVERQDLELNYLQTELMIADSLTRS